MIKVGIVGATGYTGSELLRLLAQHPEVNLTALTSRSEKGLAVADLFPGLRKRVDLTFNTPEDAQLEKCDVVFFATPHGVAMQQAPALLEKGVKVIDLGADFRLQDTAEFEKWYGIAHSCPEVLQTAVYGLPELSRKLISQAQIIGLPGCYPTAVQLGFAPLLAHSDGLVDESTLIADVKSGVSGAGRKAEINLLMSECTDNFKAYAVSGHRHWPEIMQGLKAIRSYTKRANDPLGLTFVPHLVPMIRGIHATLYAKILPNKKTSNFQSLFEEFYAGEYFVDVLPQGRYPETRSVRASNQVRIALTQPQGSDLLVIMVVEDNLVKGAAGQGVQCMNLMFDLPENTGLTQLPTSP